MNKDLARFFHEIAEAARWLDACNPNGTAAAEERKMAEEQRARWNTSTLITKGSFSVLHGTHGPGDGRGFFVCGLDADGALASEWVPVVPGSEPTDEDRALMTHWWDDLRRRLPLPLAQE